MLSTPPLFHLEFQYDTVGVDARYWYLQRVNTLVGMKLFSKHSSLCDHDNQHHILMDKRTDDLPWQYPCSV